jgi:acetolactate synthase small subunit
MKHIIAVLLENEPGALSRVVALFSARGYNIESLTVAPTEDASLSRMTIVTTGSDEVIEQITKHLNRLIEVVKVVDLTEGSFIERELMLIKVRAVGKDRRRDEAHGGHLPRAHSRRHGEYLHDRAGPARAPNWTHSSRRSTGARYLKPCEPALPASPAANEFLEPREARVGRTEAQSRLP